ncbi:MAG TPA: SfnB family sulfur acquisition oxidoreductase [Marmoricola sp.]|nr:SfnB family sulfur acquisition oxidoreductase [Marmoricola sp.]
MTIAPQLRPGVPVLSQEQALAVAEQLAAEFAPGAVARDRERRLPYAEVERLKASGLLSITVPTTYGGPGLPPSTVSAVVAVLAEADPNIAQAVHSHFVYCNLIRVSADPTQQAALYDRVLSGRLIANAQAERSGPTANDVATTLSLRTDGRLLLTGTKYYCTGSPFADVVAVLAELDDATGATGLPYGQVIVFVPIGTHGLTVHDDWDALGQRVTGSGTVGLDRVEVRRRWVVPRTAFDAPNGYGAFAQLLHASIDVGIARAALRDAAEFVRTRSRPWFEAGVDRADEDVLTLQRFGELEVDRIAADAVLERAQRSVDAVFTAPDVPSATRASLDVAAAKVLAERAAVGLGSSLFEVCGTRSVVPDAGLDRHWCNARTHTLHDPVRWKYQHLGRHALTGQAPPRHGSI